MLLNILALLSLLVGVLLLSSARLGLCASADYAQYKMKSETHMRVWGWILLVLGIAACIAAGLLFAS